MKSKSNIYAPILFSAVLILAGLSQKLMDIIARLPMDSFLSVSIIQLAVFLLPLAFYCKICGIDYIKNLKFNYFPINMMSFCVITFILFFAGSIFLRFMGISFFGGAMLDTPNIIYATAEGGKPVLSFIVFIILPAVFEEFLFRGILLSEYRVYSSSVAVLMTSLMYAMAHASFANFAYYFFAGIIFGVLTTVTDSVLPALILHLIYDIFYFYFTDNIINYIRQTGKSTLLPFIMVAMILFLLFLLFSSLEDIYKDRAFGELLKNRKELLRQSIEKDEDKEEKGFIKKFGEALLSPTFALSIAIFIFLAANLF